MTEKDRNNNETHTETHEHDAALQEHAPSRPQVVADPTKAQDSVETAPKDPLEEARREAADNRDRWLRAVADLENYRKRMTAEKSTLLKYRNEELLRDLLVVVDNLERALHHATESGTNDALTEGVSMIVGMFKETLVKHGLKEIVALGQPFDPHFHEAIAKIPAGDQPNNTVVNEVEKGWMYNDRLLRPSKVVVAIAE